MSSPRRRGTHFPVVDTRADYDAVTRLYLPIAVAVVALVGLLVVGLALRYRAREGDRPPSRVASAPRTEAVYVVVLAAVAALLLWRTFTIEAKVDGARVAAGALRVDVTAAKWHWRFAYPADGIVVRGTDASPPTLVVPVGRRVRFTLRSVDVIHAFWIPAQRFKRDATPGEVSSFTLVFPHVGFTRDGGECSEFCGLRHSWMRFDVRVVDAATFARWRVAHRAARAGA